MSKGTRAGDVRLRVLGRWQLLGTEEEGPIEFLRMLASSGESPDVRCVSQ